MSRHKKYKMASIAILLLAIAGISFLMWGINEYSNIPAGPSLSNYPECVTYTQYQREDPSDNSTHEHEYPPQSSLCILEDPPTYSFYVLDYPTASCSYEPEYPPAPPHPTPTEPPPFTHFPERIPVLAYHSILPKSYYYPNLVSNAWVLSLDVFYSQMRYLYENNFTTITSDQLIDFLFNDKGLPENPIILTFDDGYLDNALFAAPIMRQFGFVGMQFLITGLIPEYVQPLATRPIQHMSTAEIMETSDVFEFGSHTHAMHSTVNGTPLLVSESVEAIKNDILRSFEYPLTFTTGFAYPFGRHSTNARQALLEAGVLFAFTTQGGYLCIDTDPLLIPRFSITGDPPGWSMTKFSDIVWGRWG